MCSNVLEDYELKALQSEHAAEQYAVRHNTSKRTASGWRDPKQRLQSEFSDTVHHVQDALQVFKERGVLHHTEYDADVPAAVHGAPKTAEVMRYIAQHFSMLNLLHTLGDFSHQWWLQESKASLERLRRMGQFEAQDFDIVVRIESVSSRLLLSSSCLRY